MSQNSKIEWTDHTFNPWWGCQKVSAGCKNCYAETLDNRWKGGHWGPGSDRKPMSEKYWAQPLKWNEDARKKGIRAKVFCASMADVFEDHPQTLVHRLRLFKLIDETPDLLWLLLTKRPENITRLSPIEWNREGWPYNVWIGTSVENQEMADERIPHLLQVKAGRRFLSCEPLLGPVDLSLLGTLPGSWGYGYRAVYDLLHWVIVGGESGPHARPMHPDWARSLRDQCKDAGVSFFFKQWGEWVNEENQPSFIAGVHVKGIHNLLIDGRKYDTGWISDVNRLACMKKVGKKLSGRLLDKVEHNEFPFQ